MSVSSFWLHGSRMVYIIMHFFQSFSTRQNPVQASGEHQSRKRSKIISMLTKDDWLLHLFIYLFHLFEFDWFFCRCSLATVIELQWSNIFFILARESLLEVFVSTLKLGMAIFQWEWRYMAVKKVCKFFVFYHSLSMWLYQGTPCRELCQTQACDF